MIRLETSQRRGIENHQDREISDYERNWSRDIPKKYPRVVARTGNSAIYNCHGLTFASRRTNVISWSELQKILSDDKYIELQIADVLPGDIVIYLRDGDANHSGVIVQYERTLTILPMVCSKWGNAGEFIHSLSDHPPAYGPDHKFYRCKV